MRSSNAATEATPGAQPAERDGGWAQLLTLVLASAVAVITMLVLWPQLSTLSEVFRQPVSIVAWTLVIVSIMGTAFGAAMAGLGALWGNRLMLIFSVLAMLVGSIVAVFANNITTLIVARGIQGLGFGLLPLCMGIITVHYGGGSMRRGLSLIVSSTGIGAIVGYLVSGLFGRAGVAWHGLFWVAAGLSLLVLCLTLTFVQETPRHRDVRVDWVGAVGLLVWAVLILLPLSQANSWGWNSPRLLGMLLPGILILALWCLWELWIAAPLLDLRILAKPGVWQGAVVWGSAGFGASANGNIMSYLVQTPRSLGGYGFGGSVLATALVLSAHSISVSLAAPATPLLQRRFGSRRTLLIGAVAGCAYFGMAAWHVELWMVVVFLACCGVGCGWAGVAMTVAAEAVLPQKGVVASGIVNAVGNLFGATAGALTGYVFTLRTNTFTVPAGGSAIYLTLPAGEAFVWTMTACGLVALVGVFAALTVNSRKLEAVASNRPLSEHS